MKTVQDIMAENGNWYGWGRVLAVVNGDWLDSWDSGAECPIYYWYKED